MARENNPLKFSPSADAALANLLGTQTHQGFMTPVDALRDAYNDYVAAQQRLVAAVHAIPDQQSQAWQEYLNRLSDSGSSPKRVPRRDWSTVSIGSRGSRL